MRRETTAKKGHHFREGMTKKVASFFFQEKNRVTPSVAAAGDTNPSDATLSMSAISSATIFSQRLLNLRLK